MIHQTKDLRMMFGCAISTCKEENELNEHQTIETKLVCT